MSSQVIEVDHERPGRATCLNLGLDPESTIGKIICSQALRIRELENALANDSLTDKVCADPNIDPAFRAALTAK